jgi:hypothetical protein
MTRGQRGSEPAGISGDAFYVLAMYAGDQGLTTTVLHGHVQAENEALDCPVPGREQLRHALMGLARSVPPLVERAGTPRKGVEPSWRITAHGYAMLARWAGEDDEPARVPCGLGWPPDARPGARVDGLPSPTRAPGPGHPTLTQSDGTSRYYHHHD